MSDVRVSTPWPGPVRLSFDDIAVQVDVCVREDYDEAQRVARLRARFRNVRQRIEMRYTSWPVGEPHPRRAWRVGDDVDLLGRPR